MDAETIKEQLKQEHVTLEDYLRLTSELERTELVNNKLEAKPVVYDNHTAIVMFLVRRMQAALGDDSAVHGCEQDTITGPGSVRRPDVIALRSRRDPRRKRAWTGADFAIEVISEDGEKRDYIDKHAEYASIGIPEYWIVDPPEKKVTVFTLHNARYDIGREYFIEDTVVSETIADFTLKVREILEQD